MPSRRRGPAQAGNAVLVVPTRIERSILFVRGHKVMLDSHLAALYGVETRALVQAVKRNWERFPGDFMFQLTWDEVDALRTQLVTSNDGDAAKLRSQIVISNGAQTRGSKSQSVILNALSQGDSRSQAVTLKRGRNPKYRPHAFTEQGVAMLSSVLRSPRAIQVNVEIMRAFVRLRGMLAAHRDLAQRLDELEKKYDGQFAVVFEAICELMAPPKPRRRGRIGFRVQPRQPGASGG